ncbi:hypothetical protein [Microcoleus sp. EPA2]
MICATFECIGEGSSATDSVTQVTESDREEVSGYGLLVMGYWLLVIGY